MNDVRESAPAPGTAAPAVDERNPWLGLASFTEETRAYFYGREEEVAELARRVQRKLLTILFGQSGLGKTSILRAGLVPRLRGQGYCPIYVRIDYGREAPEPAVQIKQAIAQTARRSGEWTQVGVAVEGESLWEFLHHRDDVLHDESGATLIPLLIFDQFEEIFTLAQSDDFGRARAARFIADLADLVENRPPKELEARLEVDDAAAEGFDFARSDYRVLIALREDYLAPLESLKSAMPSITQNRLRLAPMTGQQALAAVMRPGKGLVSEEVAAAIVRFVAGGAEVANAEVEPSLLSLICRELNDARVAQGRSEISLDLLAGSHASILSNFYERSLADQPAAVRHIIEDELVTASGFRENVAEERMLTSFAAAGAAPDTLAVLVNRRLLRIEERLDVRRVELTHDVLCSVVRSSRDLRKEREARDATEKLLAEQRARELSARRSLVRARQIAIVCTVLAIGALAAAAVAYVSTQRALRAERQAEETRIAANQARGHAEQLLGYLTDDFARELGSFGRVDLVAGLAKRQLDYFKALPPGLKDRDTTRNGALAMVQYARAMRTLGNMPEARSASNEGVQLLQKLRQEGDTSERTTIALATGTMVQEMVLNNEQSPQALPTVQRAADLLKPLATAPNASFVVRRAYIEVLGRLGYEQLRAFNTQVGLATLQLAMQEADALGAKDLTHIDMSAEYAQSAGFRIEALGTLGRGDEARRVGADASAVAAKVLAIRPGYLLALRAQNLIASNLGALSINQMRNEDALVFLKIGEQASRTLARLDPGNTIALSNLGVDLRVQADALWSMGRLRESNKYFIEADEVYKDTEHAGASFILSLMNARGTLQQRQADVGDAEGLRSTQAKSEQSMQLLRRTQPTGSFVLASGECLIGFGPAEVALLKDDFATSRRLGRDCISRMRAMTPHGSTQEFFRNAGIFYSADLVGQAEYLLGDYAAAERTLREGMEARKNWPTATNGDRREEAEVSTWLAMALARQGRGADAQSVIAPIVKLHRDLATQNHDDAWQRVELAAALYAQALADKPHRAALLNEAALLVARVPAEMRDLRSVRQWRDRIHNEQRAPAVAMTRVALGRGAG
jgi:tetratricopeptide (TPR) repeat protein